MKKLVMTAALAASANAVPAFAQFTTYTNRTTFTAAAGPLTTETFNSYATDTQFRTGAVDVGPFSLIGAGNRQDDRNYIDASPYAFGSFFAVNGTSYVQGQVGGFSDGTSSFTIQFDAPISAFGADFSNLNDLPGITRIVVGSTTLSPGSVNFFGFTSTTAFSTVQFVSSNPGGPNSIDNFGLDNLSFTAPQVGGAVPEPATWAMLIAGFAMVGTSLRRRRASVGYA